MRYFSYIFILLLIPACQPKADNTQTNDYDNIKVEPIYSDSLVSSFYIWVKKEVRSHKHAHHTEHVQVLEGKGNFTLADSTFIISKGDLVVIPKNTYHSVVVISENPMKVISIQAPYFDGSDRVFEEKAP